MTAACSSLESRSGLEAPSPPPIPRRGAVRCPRLWFWGEEPCGVHTPTRLKVRAVWYSAVMAMRRFSSVPKGSLDEPVGRPLDPLRFQDIEEGTSAR